MADAPARAPGDLTPQPHGGALAAPWPKGVSGNPKGKAKGTQTRLERLLDHALQKRGEDGRTARQRGIAILAEQFAKGDPKTVALVFDIDSKAAARELKSPEALVQVNVGNEADDVHVHTAERVSEAVEVVLEVLGRGE